MDVRGRPCVPALEEYSVLVGLETELRLVGVGGVGD